MNRAALYVRVSTDRQTVENQLIRLREMASARGFTDFDVYQETRSGAGPRPELERLIEDAARGKVRTVFVWALDRLGRSESLQSMVASVLELDRLKVRVASYSETWVDTDPDSPLRSLLLKIFEWVAVQERRRLRERTRAGLDRARAQGKKLGRPLAAPNGAALDPQQVAFIVRSNSVSYAAKHFEVSRATIRRLCARAGPNAVADLAKKARRGAGTAPQES